MKKIVIGSFALIQYLNNFQRREFRKPKDLDIIANYETVGDLHHFEKSLESRGFTLFDEKIAPTLKKIYRKQNKYLEVEIANDNSTQQLLDYVLQDNDSKFDGKWIYPSLKVLYLLKMSHRFLDNAHFYKTMADIRLMRTLTKADFLFAEEKSPAWYLSRVEENYFNNKYPKLNTEKNQFFTDNVNYRYDHDELHEVVKIDDEPAYRSLLVDGQEVLMDERKFYKAQFNKKLNCVVEEASVLALERYIVPLMEKFPPTDECWDRGLQIALRKVCTTITSGFFRKFAWEQHDTALAFYEKQKEQGTSYRDKFLDSNIKRIA